MFVLKLVRNALVSSLVCVMPLQYAFASTTQNNIKSKTSIFFETGYSRSKNMKKDYGAKMGSSLLLGFGAKYEAYKKINLGISVTQRTGYKFDKTVSDGSDVFRASQNIDIITVLPTISYDIISLLNSKVTPFVELGVGISQIKANTYHFENTTSLVPPSTTAPGDRKITFSYSAMLGSSFKINDSISVALGIRHINFGKVTTVLIGSGKEKGGAKANEFSTSLIINL
jgi:opacity protein-like surface antigen